LPPANTTPVMLLIWLNNIASFLVGLTLLTCHSK